MKDEEENAGMVQSGGDSRIEDNRANGSCNNWDSDDDE